MCRHLAYVGPPEPVGELLTRGVHALRTQAWAPRDMRGGGTINADGFGVAWWRHAGHPGQARVSRYRNAAPIWTDPAVDEVLPQIESTAVLGAVRSATVGMPVERAACAPFIDDGWAFSHNGVVPNWRKALTAALADLDNAATRAGATRMFQTADLLDAESATDSAAMWVLLRGLLTPGPCLRRVQRLEAEGVIRGYRAVIDPGAVGRGVGVLGASTPERPRRGPRRREEG
ncbi:class II glutamine amidotransferase, partial [Nocardia cyriacigeorgica]|uniref:class II glutamine amidotransferase n=1 Tax=Nocardia cyriacigeorgica TaxID=135487 RepID=UPI002453D8AB